MSQVINTNVAALTAQRNLNSSQQLLATSVQRLSSGLRVNTAKDDAAGLAISERMNAEIKGQKVAIRNANDAISLSQTAEGALGKISDSLQRMRELAVQSTNATNTGKDRAALDAEFEQLQAEIKRVAEGTKFNGTGLFDSSGTLSFQVGAGTATADSVSITRSQLTGGSAGTSGSLTSSSTMQVSFATVTSTATGGSDIAADATAAQNAIKDIDNLLDQVNTERAKFGAAQNRFESIVSFLNVSTENMQASRSRIVDADYATETSNLTRSQILQQAGTAMLAQANQVPQGVLSLIR